MEGWRSKKGKNEHCRARPGAMHSILKKKFKWYQSVWRRELYFGEFIHCEER